MQYVLYLWFSTSLVLPDSRTSFHLNRESGPTQLTNVNSLEGGCLKFKTIGSAQSHSGAAITNRQRLTGNHVTGCKPITGREDVRPRELNLTSLFSATTLFADWTQKIWTVKTH